jgi:SAM-dependent methyltransferase
VDISEPMLAVARTRAAAEGLDNVTFELADAQVYPFADNQFDVAISRFGTMFFGDPVAAFTNIGRAARRLVMLVWQGRERQEWVMATREAVGPDDAGAQAAFSLADPATVEAILTKAGFTTLETTDVSEPVFYGRTAAAAYEAVMQLRMASVPLDRLTGAERELAQDRLRNVLAAHENKDGVWFDSRAWLVIAHRGDDG